MCAGGVLGVEKNTVSLVSPRKSRYRAVKTFVGYHPLISCCNQSLLAQALLREFMSRNDELAAPNSVQ